MCFISKSLVFFRNVPRFCPLPVDSSLCLEEESEPIRIQSPGPMSGGESARESSAHCAVTLKGYTLGINVTRGKPVFLHFRDYKPWFVGTDSIWGKARLSAVVATC